MITLPERANEQSCLATHPPDKASFAQLRVSPVPKHHALLLRSVRTRVAELQAAGVLWRADVRRSTLSSSAAGNVILDFKLTTRNSHSYASLSLKSG